VKVANKKHSYIIGIDEVGRGPLAGPVAVGAVCLPFNFKTSLFRGVKDSKQLTAEMREAWLKRIRTLKKDGMLSFAVDFQSHQTIDEKGLSYAIKKALSNTLKKINKDPRECLVLLDGGLTAPKEYLYQKTIIKGDEKKIPIALASIAAKVMRDARMKRFALKYCHYDFEVHKGYGTKGHYKKIKKYGMSAIHRRSFLKKVA
jgi:ribonuclease HII